MDEWCLRNICHGGKIKTGEKYTTKSFTICTFDPILLGR
jgi:hypothetical protein